MTQQTKSPATFLGYRDEHGNEMHCSRETCDECKGPCQRPVAKLKSPAEQMDVRFSPLEEFMERFSDHGVECAANTGTAKCSCGYDEARAALRQPAVSAGEPVKLIDERLADLRKANEAFRAQNYDRDADIQRNNREILWLRDLRTLLLAAALPPSNPPGAEPKGALAAAMENIREAWAALAMIRETVETLAPSGAVTAAEHLDGPTFTHEADALVEGIIALYAANPPGDVRDIKSLAAEAIRTFCKSLGEGTVAISTDGVERIYYSGLSLEALAAAVAMKLTSPKDAEATSVGAHNCNPAAE